MTGDYDFSDWETGPPPDLSEWVKENLRHAFKSFSDGCWHMVCGPALQWSLAEFDSSPATISITPGDLKECLIDEIDSRISENIKSQAQHDDLLKFVEIIKEWKSAIDDAFEHANRVLESPIDDSGIE